jgi:hypothetical protein
MMNDRDRRLMARADGPAGWRSGGVPPGVRGAGWFIVTIFAFSVVVLAGWAGGWWEGGHSTATPAASHRVNG